MNKELKDILEKPTVYQIEKGEDYYTADQVKAAFEAGQPKWNKYSEVKPEEFQRVAVFKLDTALICYGVAIYSKNKFRLDATIINNEKLFSMLSDKPINGITHWIPLTPPNQYENL